MLFGRALGEEQLVVALNFGGTPETVRLAPAAATKQVLLSTFGDREGETVGGSLGLRPHEGAVIEYAAATSARGEV